MTTEKQKDIELFHQWKNNPSPSTLNPLMQQLRPAIIGEALKWKQSGINPSLLESHAYQLAYDSLQTFDPSLGYQLNTHLTNHLRKMSRYAIQHQNAIRVPEEKVFEYRKQMSAREELLQKLGREPSPMEIAEHVGSGNKIGDYKPLVEHFYSKSSEAGGSPAMQELSMDAVALHLMHDNLTEEQRFVFDHSYGYKGAPILPNQVIAQKLKKSPGMVSKIKNNVEDLLRSYQDATSYIGN